MKLKGLKPSLGVKDWYAGQKTKRAAQRALISTNLRILTFAFTLSSMALGLSLLPLFPQPLPIIIAFLIAFVAYYNPVFSLPIGGALIGAGLIYNMSKVNFISNLGDQFVREAVIFAFLFVLTLLPIIFHRHKDAIAIDLGIIAAILLFSGQAYFLAIPLIFASIVIFRKHSVLTAIYYGLISTPLLMMQYLGFIIRAARIRPDWWVLPNSSPPIFASLKEILKTVQDSMVQFRLFDTSKVVYTITAQVTQDSPPAEHTITEVLSHYLDSVPGIVLYLVIIAIIAASSILLIRVFLKTANVSDRALPPIAAAVGTLIFYICLSALQEPLAFYAKIDVGKMAIGTIAAAVFALPAVFFDQTPKRRATVDMIGQKARELLDRLDSFQTTLHKVQETLPVDVSSIEGKMLVLKDKLNDVLSKTLSEGYEPSEIDEVFKELEVTSKELDSLNTELDISLKAYQMLVEGEYSTWIGRFQDIGLQISATERKVFPQDLPVGERITRIKETIDSGEFLANDALKVAVKAYSVIRTFYDPKLPEESQAVAFAKKQLAENNPWIASNSIFTALNNWRKHYSSKISRSVDIVRNSISVVAGLRDQRENLRPVLGDDFSEIMDVAKRAENLELDIETNVTAVGNVVRIGEILLSSLDIVRDTLVVLSEQLRVKEKSIDSLLPTEGYVWEKNATLRDHMNSMTDVFLNHHMYQLDQAFENLPQAAAYIDECLSTIARYNDQEEVLLNYPVAETVIEDSLKQKQSISAHDLPFEPKIAEEYLKLFHSRRCRDYSFDSQKVTLGRAKT